MFISDHSLLQMIDSFKTSQTLGHACAVVYFSAFTDDRLHVFVSVLQRNCRRLERIITRLGCSGLIFRQGLLPKSLII